ncbi:hypothetical protein QTP86_019873 [Hemibagrus guttatus]|nr:hypothetical protein QTP86_019873 [Hemibagrus guttatus]
MYYSKTLVEAGQEGKANRKSMLIVAVCKLCTRSDATKNLEPAGTNKQTEAGNDATKNLEPAGTNKQTEAGNGPPPRTFDSSVQPTKDPPSIKTTQSAHRTASSSGESPNVETKNSSDLLDTNNQQGAEQGQQPENAAIKFDARYLWLLVLVVAVLAVVVYFGCFKGQNLPVETMDHGTENASFQRTESKDGVMLLGVKSGGEENAK